MFARLGAWWARDLRPPSQEKEVAVVTHVLHIFCIMPHGFCCELQWRIWPSDPVHHRLSCGLSLFIIVYPCSFPCSSTSAAGSRRSPWQFWLRLGFSWALWAMFEDTRRGYFLCLADWWEDSEGSMSLWPFVATAGPLRWFPHPAPPADGAEAPPRPCWQRAGSPRCHPPRAQWKWSEWRPRTRCRTRSRSPAHPCWTSPAWMSLEVRLWRWTWTTTVLAVLKTLWDGRWKSWDPLPSRRSLKSP